MTSYMDQFTCPEEFIRNEVTANRGANSVYYRSELVALVVKAAEDDETTKVALFNALVALRGAAYLSKLEKIGVSAHNVMQKFDITNPQLKRLSKAGIFRVSAWDRVNLYGRMCDVPLYSPYDYFRRTPEEVHSWLEAHSRKRKEAIVSHEEKKS